MGKQVTTGQVVGIPAFQFWESNPGQSTTAQTYQNAMSRTADPMATGPYILSWYCELRIVPTGPVNSKGDLRFQVDGVSKGNSEVTAEGWIACSGWDRYFAAVGAEPVLTLDYRRNPTLGGNDTIEIRKLKLGVEKMVE